MKKSKKIKIEPYRKWTVRILKMLREKFYVKEYYYSYSFEKDEGGTMASIDISTKYLNYHIKIHKNLEDSYKKGEYQGCFTTLVHEMCHLYTEPLYLIGIDAVTNTNKEFLELIREQNTQRICGCISELFPKKLWYPKKI